VTRARPVEAHAGRYAILALVLAVQTFANVGPLGFPSIASLVRDDLHLSLTQAGSFLSAYYVGPILMSLPAGAMADRWGVKRTLVLGQVVIAGGLLAVAASPSYALLLVLMVVSGVGYGMLNPTSTKAIIAWFPPSQRATVVGLKQVGFPFGAMLGAALLPVLGLAFGWRWAVAAAALVIVAGALASAGLYHDPPSPPSAGTVSGRGAARRVLGDRDLWLVAVASLIFAGVQTVWMAYLVLYLQGVVGLPLLAASRYLALAQGGGMAGRVVFGVLSDRAFGGRRRLPLVIAGCGTALCSIAIAFTRAGSSPGWLVPLALVFGFVGIGWNGVQHTMMAELAGPRAAGAAVGFGLALSSVGVTAAPPVFGWGVEWAGGYGRPWIGLAVAMAGALLLLSLVRERPRLG